MNNVKYFPDIGKIKDEAALWVVKIQAQTYKTGEGLSEELSEELKNWMARSPEHRNQLLKMISGWEAMGMLQDLAEIMPISDLEHQHPLRRFRFWVLSKFQMSPSAAVWSGSAVVMAALVLSFSMVFFSGSQSIEYRTGVGQQATYVLEDGSAIRLNTDTSVKVEYGSEQRLVKLERGEAHFEVAKEESRPFAVFAGDGMVLAVGTAFNVFYQEDESVNVIVSEGVVKVFSGVTLRDEEPLLLIDVESEFTPDSLSISREEGSDYFREVLLEAGEAAQYSQRRVIKDTLEEEELDEELAWREGVLVFKGETLEQALIEIARYTDRRLLIVDPAISEASVGGRFKTNDIDALASSLALGLNIQAYAGEDNSILFAAK